MSTNVTRGRCRTCKCAYEWSADSKKRSLLSMRCPRCGGYLDRTSHQYKYGFRTIPTDTANLIAAGVFDDYGVGSWRKRG